MRQHKTLHRSVAALLAGGCLVAGTAEASLVTGSTFNWSFDIGGGAQTGSATYTVGSGTQSMTGTGYYLILAAPSAIADIYFNFSVGFVSTGTAVEMTFSDLDFTGGEELTGITPFGVGAAGYGFTTPVFSNITAGGFKMSYSTTGTTSYLSALYDFDTAPPAAIPEPGSLALAAGGAGLLGWRRRRHRRSAPGG
jgi:hypothetical protein